ncbi:MAG: DUF2829 domain-containing protein [Bacteroidales bacterium]
MNFGDALHALKAGHTVSRSGWNAPNQYVIFVPVQVHSTHADSVILNPHFLLKTAQGSLSMWVPSISDCLAEDWLIL